MGQRVEEGPGGHLQPTCKPCVILVAGQWRGSEWQEGGTVAGAAEPPVALEALQ